MNLNTNGGYTDKCEILSECEDVELLRGLVGKLWAIIDDIDTYSDMAKDDDKFYRARVERKQAMRWTETPIISDGYDLFIDMGR